MRAYARDSAVFRLPNLIQLGLDGRQCLEDIPPRFVLIF
jgi:hypothetical protein